jgi:hypothetical protein
MAFSERARKVGQTFQSARLVLKATFKVTGDVVLDNQEYNDE